MVQMSQGGGFNCAGAREWTSVWTNTWTDGPKWTTLRLGVLGAFFYFVLAYPIASYSYNPETQPVEAFICALVGTLTPIAAISLLIFLNWSYVRDRLLVWRVGRRGEKGGWRKILCGVQKHETSQFCLFFVFSR